MIPAERDIEREMREWNLDRLPAIRRIQSRAILLRQGADRKRYAVR